MTGRYGYIGRKTEEPTSDEQIDNMAERLYQIREWLRRAEYVLDHPSRDYVVDLKSFALKLDDVEQEAKALRKEVEAGHVKPRQ